MNRKKPSNEHIQVFVRCRPLLKSELNIPTPVEVHPEVNKILVRDIGTDKCTGKSFSYDRIFGPEAKQAEIYDQIVAPLIQEVMMGFNCTIFAYGQTGTGKTFTIEGDRTANLKNMSEDPLSGIIPRSMKHLFNDLTEQSIKFEICVSFLELYNEEIFDLLSKFDDPVKLKIFDNSAQKGSVIIQGLEVRPVTSMKEVYDILDTGFKKRRKASTLLNKASSRSHTVFTVTVNLKESSSTCDKIKSSKLNLVDLAGSENVGRSGAIEKRAREAGNINQSLLALGRVITSLCEKAGHIPYRESKLTRLLQDSLGGHTKTAVIATISPSALHVDETLNTLEYAHRAKNITNKPEVNVQVTVTSLTKDYLEEICRLEKEIYEQGNQNFCVPEETLRHWKSTLASKRKEKYKILSQIKSLMEEDKSLDAAIKEANNNLDEKRNELENTKLCCEAYRKKIEKEKEDNKLHEMMLQVLQSMHDQLHDKLHTVIQEKHKTESEVIKAIERLKTALDEHRNVQEKLQNIRRSWGQRKDQLHLNVESILKNTKNLHHNVDSLTSECENYISMLKSGFESARTLCEKGFKNICRAVNDLEAIDKSFQESAELALSHEKSTELKSIDEFYKSYLASNELSLLKPLNTALSDCEVSLRGISSVLTNWKNHLSSQMNSLQDVLKNHLDTQKTNLESMTDCVKTLLNKHTEDLEMHNNIIAECVNSGNSQETVWNDIFFCVDGALSALDLFCTEYITSETDKATQDQLLLMKSSRFGKEINEILTSYCETSVKNIDVVQKEIDLHEHHTFPAKLVDMKKKVDASREKYKDLNSELSKLSGISQKFDELLVQIEDTLDKFKDFEHPTVCTYSEEMMKSISKCVNSYKTDVMENQAEIGILLSQDKEHVGKFAESSKLLSNFLKKRIAGYIYSIENNCQKPLAAEKDTKILYDKTETNVTEHLLSSDDITIISPEHLEGNLGGECPVCKNNISDATLRCDKNGSHDTTTAQCSKNLIGTSLTVSGASASRSLPPFPRSPVRRPRTKIAPIVRRNLQFLDFEKLANQLLHISSDDEI